MHIKKNIFLLTFFILLSIDLSSNDIEEIIVKGSWRDAKVLEQAQALWFLIQHCLNLNLQNILKIFLFDSQS